MTRAAVFMGEVDLSGTVRGNSGFYGALQIKAPMGDIENPMLFGRMSDVLKQLTFNETVSIGYDNAFYSADAYLEKANKLWVSRPTKNASYASVIIKSAEYADFSGTNKISGSCTLDQISNALVITNTDLRYQLQTGSAIRISSIYPLPTPLAAGTTYYVVKIADTKFKIAATYADAVAATPVVLTLAPTSMQLVATFGALVDPNEIQVASAALDSVIVTGYACNFTGGTMPSPLQSNVTYYIIRTSATTFKLATSKANALAVVPVPIPIVGVAAGTIMFKALIATPTPVLTHTVSTPTNEVVKLSDIFTANATTDAISLLNNSKLLNYLGSAVQVSFKTTVTLPTPLEENTYYWLIDTNPVPVVPNTHFDFQVAYTLDDAINGDFINLTSVGTGVQSIQVKQLDPEAYAFNQYESLQFYAKDPSAPSNAYAVKLTDNSKKESDSFIVEVFKLPDLITPVEQPYICSRIMNKKDGYNKNIYVENIMRQSSLIRCNDNPLVDENIPPLMQSVPIRLQGGDGGDTVTDGDMILDLDKFRAIDRYPINIIMDGGNAFSDSAAYAQALLELARYRDDSVVVLSTPLDTEQSSNFLADIVDYKALTLNTPSSFGALYSPHTMIYDKYNSRKDMIVSPDGYVGGLIAETGTNYQLWYPVAGKRRGSITTITDLVRHFKDEEMDYLYDNGVNPLRYIENDGIYIWGQKTLLTRSSALDRLNVRLLLTVIKPVIKKALEGYLFEFNDSETRLDVFNKISTYMSGIQSARGVYGYLVVCDEQNNSLLDQDNHILNCWVFVKPTKSIEYIPTKIILTRTDLSFSLAAQLL